MQNDLLFLEMNHLYTNELIRIISHIAGYFNGVLKIDYNKAAFSIADVVGADFLFDYSSKTRTNINSNSN